MFHLLYSLIHTQTIETPETPNSSAARTGLPDAASTLDAVRWAAAGVLGGHPIFHLKAVGVAGGVSKVTLKMDVYRCCSAKDEFYLWTLVNVVDLEKDPQLLRGSYHFDSFWHIQTVNPN